MLLIQFTGLSGAGKTSIANSAKLVLDNEGISVAIIDGDIFRKTWHHTLGFTKEDRYQNIRRMGEFAASLNDQFKVAIIAAINPYREIREELEEKYNGITVFIHCELTELIKRDTKGLYQKAFLPDDHPEKLWNLTGVNDPYEIPLSPHLTIYTHNETLKESTDNLINFIHERLSGT